MIMDPIAGIRPHKDSSFAMLLEGQRRGWRLLYAEPGDLMLDQGKPVARARAIEVYDRAEGWYRLGEPELCPLARLDVVLIRRDPPFDREYLYDTLILERAAKEGVLVVNHPAALRDLNEKLAALAFPEYVPPSLAARDLEALRAFARRHGEIVLKPLDGMAGRSVFRTRADDPNLNVIVETVTEEGRRMAIAQRYLPEVTRGDKRILVVAGEPAPFALARIPSGFGEHRANLARGGRAEAVPLSDRDREIASRVGAELRSRGVLFAGLDVIGDYLTEINITSPTGIRELKKLCGLDVARSLFDALERELQ